MNRGPRWLVVAAAETALLIPPGVAHGFQALSDGVQLLYQHSAAHVPQLANDAPASGVNGVGDPAPPAQGVQAVEAGHIRVALALLADGRGLADEQAGTGTLGVVGGYQRGGYGPG